MSKNKKGKLFVVSGPSGSGKSSLVNDALKHLKNFERSVSVTTRVKRSDEVEGQHYYFIDQETFEDLIKKNELVEWVNYCGNYYGTLKKNISKNIENGKNVVLVIDVKGAMQVKKVFKEAYLIFITTSDIGELENRLKERKTEDMEIIEERLEKAKEEMKYQKHYDCIIVNNNYNEALKNLIYVLSSKMEGS